MSEQQIDLIEWAYPEYQGIVRRAVDALKRQGIETYEASVQKQSSQIVISIDVAGVPFKHIPDIEKYHLEASNDPYAAQDSEVLNLLLFVGVSGLSVYQQAFGELPDDRIESARKGLSDHAEASQDHSSG